MLVWQIALVHPQIPLISFSDWIINVQLQTLEI